MPLFIWQYSSSDATHTYTTINQKASCSGGEISSLIACKWSNYFQKKTALIQKVEVFTLLLEYFQLNSGMKARYILKRGATHIGPKQ